MAIIAATVAVLESRLGFPAARCRTTIRVLIDDGLIKPGAPGVAVEITEADFALIILALGSGAPLRSVAGAATALANCVPDGINTDAMPTSVRPAKQTFLDVMHDVIWNSAHGDGSLKYDIEVVETWREVSFHTGSGAVHFLPTGSMPGHWQDSKQRRSTRIPSSAIFLAARDLFGEK